MNCYNKKCKKTPIFDLQKDGVKCPNCFAVVIEQTQEEFLEAYNKNNSRANRPI